MAEGTTLHPPSLDDIPCESIPCYPQINTLPLATTHNIINEDRRNLLERIKAMKGPRPEHSSLPKQNCSRDNEFSLENSLQQTFPKRPSQATNKIPHHTRAGSVPTLIPQLSQSTAIFNERMSSYAEAASLRQRMSVEEEELKIMKECTFTPCINQTHDVANDFLTRQDKYSKCAALKAEYTKSELEKLSTIEIQPTPTICENSKRIYAKMRVPKVPEKVFERLYTHSHERKRGLAEVSKFYRCKTPETAEFPFKPQISPKAKKMRRSGSLETLLFQDATKRKRAATSIAKRRADELISQANLKHLSGKSEGFFANKFYKLYDEVWEKVLQGEKSILCEQTFHTLLGRLHLINQTETHKQLVKGFWAILTENAKIRGITKRYVKEYLTAVLGIESENPAQLKFNREQLRKKFWEMYMTYTHYKVIAAKQENEVVKLIASKEKSKVKEKGNVYERLLEKGKEYERRQIERGLIKSRKEIQEMDLRKKSRVIPLEYNKHRSSLSEYSYTYQTLTLIE